MAEAAELVRDLLKRSWDVEVTLADTAGQAQQLIEASGAAMAVMQVLYSQYCGASKQSTEGETA